MSAPKVFVPNELLDKIHYFSPLDAKQIQSLNPGIYSFVQVRDEKKSIACQRLDGINQESKHGGIMRFAKIKYRRSDVNNKNYICAGEFIIDINNLGKKIISCWTPKTGSFYQALQLEQLNPTETAIPGTCYPVTVWGACKPEFINNFDAYGRPKDQSSIAKIVAALDSKTPSPLLSTEQKHGWTPTLKIDIPSSPRANGADIAVLLTPVVPIAPGELDAVVVKESKSCWQRFCCCG